MKRPSSLHDLGYSRDQYYRRVRLLCHAQLINPARGKHNELLLGSTDRLVLESFRNIELKYAKHSLEWCLEHLKAKTLQERLDRATDQTTYLQAENRALRKSLVKYRRWSIKRLWKRVRSVVRLGRPTHSE